MDFRLGERSDAFREEIREFFAEYVTPEVIAEAHASGSQHDDRLHQAMADRGYVAASWPAEFGGQDRDPFEMAAFFEEAGLAGAPIDSLGVTMSVASIVQHAGTDWQREELIPRVLRGEIHFCLGYSEPDSGSDVAAAQTRAMRDGDEWVINGQKMFTTLAHVADYVILLTRTNTEVPKHKGLTMFLVPLDTPGIEIQPVDTLGDHRTNITFYTDVRIHDRWRLGEVDGGWDVMKVGLAYERGVFSVPSEGVQLLQRAVAWASDHERPDGTRVIDDPAVRDRLARVAIDNEVATLLAYRTAWVASTGALPGLEGSVSKLFASESFQKATHWVLETTGELGVLQEGAEGAPDHGWFELQMRHSVVSTIYGGTSEIQRNAVAERMLGLPKARR